MSFLNNNSLALDGSMTTMVVPFVLFSSGLEFYGGEDKLKKSSKS